MSSRFLRAAPVSALIAAVACSSAATQAAIEGDWNTEVIPRNASALPAGTNVTVQLDQEIALPGTKAGDAFTMHVTQPVVALDLKTVIPTDAIVFGRVAAIEPSRDTASAAFVRLAFDSLQFARRRYPFSAVVVRVALPDAGTSFTPPQTDTSQAPRRGFVVRDSASTRISLGSDPPARLPAGTRMTLRATRRIAF